MIKNFIVDHIVRGNMYSTGADHELLWSLNQISNPSLTMESESVDAKDALGTPIMSFDRSKTCTFSAENAIFDMGLLGAQLGTAAKENESAAIPVFEEYDVTDTTITLKHTPVEGSLTYIYVLNGDGSLGKAYKKGAGDKTTFAVSDTTLTLPTDVKSGQVFVPYEYTGKATTVINSAKEFPKSGRFVMEVLGRDVCDATNEVYAMLVLPNAKLSASTDITFDTESTQKFELTAQQNYCSTNNELFTLLIAED